MSKRIVPHNQDLRNQAISLVCNGQVSKDGKDGQCFVSTADGLYLANTTSCSCSEQPCVHTIAADLYNRARYTVKTIIERRRISLTRLSWILEDDLTQTTDTAVADRLTICLAVCEQLHQEMLDASRRQARFHSSYCVSLAGLTRRDGRNWSTSRRERRGHG